MKQILKRMMPSQNSLIDRGLITKLSKCSEEPPIKLVEHCKSINNSYKKGNYTTVTIVVRAVLDYIPTIFGFTDAAQTHSQIRDRRTFKKALQQLDEASRNIADDSLHSPARKGEVLKVSKMTVDNFQGNLTIVLSETLEQLRTNDLRDEGTAKLAERRAIEAKPNRSQLETIEDFIVEQSWYEEYLDDNKVWICESDNLYQIHVRDDHEDFSETWTKVYPDKLGSGKYSVDLLYNGTVIKRFTFVYCDGGRISVVLPKIHVDKADLLKHDGVDRRVFYWEKDSLGFKLMKLVGNFYIYETPENVAKKSKIEIRPNLPEGAPKEQSTTSVTKHTGTVT